VSGEASFTIKAELYAMRVGTGTATAVAARLGQSAPNATHLADEEKRLRRRYERSVQDVRGVLETLRDDGVPLLPHDDRLPVVAHPDMPIAKSRLRFEGAGATGERWRLDIVVDRPLSDAALRGIENGVEQLMWPPPPTIKRVHHLSCLTMCPVGGALCNERGLFVCHCLLLETEQGLVLVDTALGIDAILHPPMHTSRIFLSALRPKMDVSQTAARQIERLGHQVSDVRHIILTHLDLDHAGGLPDFPQAIVHVMKDELEAATAPASFLDRERYRRSLWSHDVKWSLHETKGERWYGFECVRDLPGLPPEILVVPLRGHTRGHAGIAVDVGGRWLLHCGDAYFHKDEMNHDRPRASVALAGFQRFVAVDDDMRRKNQSHLRELAHGVGVGISLFSAHDPDELDRMRAEQLPST
jgi:glyoxylase-like metal-dependent hydrolase (beta-lactamase superfamily II)